MSAHIQHDGQRDRAKILLGGVDADPVNIGAGGQDRTGDLLITSQPLRIADASDGTIRAVCSAAMVRQDAPDSNTAGKEAGKEYPRDLASRKIDGRLHVLVACQHCQSEMWVRPHDLKRGYGKYCSLRCSAFAKPRPPRKLTWVEKSRLFRERFPEKVRAHAMVRVALRRGDLVRSLKCEQCNRKRRTQAHHDDYAKPLDVRWLCPSCHSKHHATHEPHSEDVPRISPTETWRGTIGHNGGAA